MPQINEEMNKIYFKQLAIKLLIVSFVCFSLYSIAFLPLYLTLNADILYQNEIITIVVYYLMKAAELIGMVISTAIIIYSLYLIQIKETINLCLIFTVVTLYKYITNYVVTAIISGGISLTFYKDMNFISTIISVFLEALLLFLIVFFSHKIINNIKKRYKISRIAAKKAGVEAMDYRSLFFPFQKLLNRKNPIQNAALLCSGIFLAKNYIEWIILFIYDGVNNLGMYGVISYVSTVISEFVATVIIYFIIIYTLVTLDNLTQKYLEKAKKADEKNYIESLKQD